MPWPHNSDPLCYGRQHADRLSGQVYGVVLCANGLAPGRAASATIGPAHDRIVYTARTSSLAVCFRAGAGFIACSVPSGGFFLLTLLLVISLFVCSGVAHAAPPANRDRPTTPAVDSASLANVSVADYSLPDTKPDKPGSPDTPSAKPPPQDRQPTISSSEAARIARSKVDGRVLNVVLQHSAGQPYYLVKILQQGQVRLVHVDARPQ